MKDEKLQIASVHAAIAKGEDSIKNGKTYEFTEDMLSEISAKARQRLGKTLLMGKK